MEIGGNLGPDVILGPGQVIQANQVAVPHLHETRHLKGHSHENQIVDMKDCFKSIKEDFYVVRHFNPTLITKKFSHI